MDNDERLKHIPCAGAIEELNNLKVRLFLSDDERRFVKSRETYLRRLHFNLKQRKYNMKTFDYEGDSPLTDKEFDVLELLKGGYNYAEVGKIMMVSPLTIRTHVNHLFEKLHVNSLQELLVKEFNRKNEIEKQQYSKKKSFDDAMKIFKKRW